MAVWWYSSRYGIIGKTLQIHWGIEASTAQSSKLIYFSPQYTTGISVWKITNAYMPDTSLEISIEDISHSPAPFMVSGSTSLLAQSRIYQQDLIRKFFMVHRSLACIAGSIYIRNFLIANSNVAGGIHSIFDSKLNIFSVYNRRVPWWHFTIEDSMISFYKVPSETNLNSIINCSRQKCQHGQLKDNIYIMTYHMQAYLSLYASSMEI